MFDHLLTEARNPASEAIDELPTEAMLRVISSEDSKVPQAVAAEISRIAAAVDAIAQRLRDGGRLFYVGAGTSGRLGVLDAAECPPTFNVSPELVQGIIAGGEAALARATEASEDDAALGAHDLMARACSAADAVMGIAASGRTPYVIGAVRKARALGALTAAIVCTPGSELAAAADYPIEPLVGPEVITGSTRMKAGTATKLVLNMISTGVMIRLGHVFGNLMINVQPKNAKLRDRATRIIAAAAQIPRERAAELLREAGGVKPAILMARRGLTPAEASRLLERAGGILHLALKS